MNKETLVLCLRDYMDTQDGWGFESGFQVQEKLRAVVEADPTHRIFAISLAGVARIDTTFARGSVVELARRYRTERGFCLRDAGDPPRLSNWDAAALRRDQPLLLWNGDQCQVLGPPLSPGLQPMFQYVLSVPVAFATQAAQHLDLKIANTSNKLKHLWEAGYILRRAHPTPVRGVEYEYLKIG